MVWHRSVPNAEHPRCGRGTLQSHAVAAVVRAGASDRRRRLSRFTAPHRRQWHRVTPRRHPVRRPPQMHRTRLQHHRGLNYHSQAGKSTRVFRFPIVIRFIHFSLRQTATHTLQKYKWLTVAQYNVLVMALDLTLGRRCAINSDLFHFILFIILTT